MADKDLPLLAVELSRAFDFATLEAAVQRSTGDRLFRDLVGPGKPLRATCLDLLNAYEETGSTVLFLSHVYAIRPGKEALLALIAKYFPDAAMIETSAGPELSLQNRGEALADQATGRAFAPGLQRNVKPHLKMLDVLQWREGLDRARRAVCQIVIDGSPLGTGFLVGPDAVLTNWHVVEKVADDALGSIECLFDFAVKPDGSRNYGPASRLAADGRPARAPYAPAEATDTPDAPPPVSGELDYALLRLASALGDQNVDTGGKRGWIVLPTAVPPTEKGSAVLILQHPDRKPMKLALDQEAVIGPVHDGLRLRYSTNTESGSSGSPCFDMDWRLIALHHYGDPSWGQPMYNQGVPAGLIRADIEAKGFGALLGA